MSDDELTAYWARHKQRELELQAEFEATVARMGGIHIFTWCAEWSALWLSIGLTAMKDAGRKVVGPDLHRNAVHPEAERAPQSSGVRVRSRAMTEYERWFATDGLYVHPCREMTWLSMWDAIGIRFAIEFIARMP